MVAVQGKVQREPQREWVLLTYRFPREPSTPRIAHWRALKRLGAAQVRDGVAALPLDSRTREHLEWLADAVLEAGGMAQVWIARLASVGDERRLVDQMRGEAAREFRNFIAAVSAAVQQRGSDQRRSVSALRRELRQIMSRDYFRVAERAEAERIFRALLGRVEAVA